MSEQLFPDNDGFVPDGRTMQAYIADYNEARRCAAAGSVPSSDDLAEAPRIERWFMCPLPREEGQPETVHVRGFFFGHPYIRMGSTGQTSPVLQIAADQSWVRCASRLYRLGVPELQVAVAHPA